MAAINPSMWQCLLGPTAQGLNLKANLYGRHEFGSERNRLATPKYGIHYPCRLCDPADPNVDRNPRSPVRFVRCVLFLLSLAGESLLVHLGLAVAPSLHA